MGEGVKIRTNDKEWQRLKDGIKKATKTRLLVGSLEGADAKHPNANATVGEVAIWNEFGTMTIPARSFARDWASLHKKRFAKDLASAHAVIILGREDSERILGNLGRRYASSMKKRIVDGIPPPNAASTLAQKDGDTPLIDTGTLLETITHKVVSE